jgi:hypothetical protein
VCFSTTADVVAGTALVPVAGLSLHAVEGPREIPFAALPALFAAHQLIEALVWAGQDGDVSAGVAHAAAVAYVLIALPLLPTLFPLAVLLIEPRATRHRIAPFLAVGVVVSAVLGWSVLRNGVAVTEHAHTLEYAVGVSDGWLWSVLYVGATMGSALMSSHRLIVAFGVVNGIGLTAVAIAYTAAFTSLWCVYAALASILVMAHLRRAATTHAGRQEQPAPACDRPNYPAPRA